MHRVRDLRSRSWKEVIVLIWRTKCTSLVCCINNRHSHTFPATPLLCCMLLLAESDTWSEACWVGIFQHCYYSEYNGWRPATRSISSLASLLATSVRASQREQKLCHHYSSDGAICSSMYSTYKRSSKLSDSTGGGGCYSEGFHSQKNIYHAGAAVTKQISGGLENMIPLGMWVLRHAASLVCTGCTVQKESTMGSLLQGWI